MKQIQGSLQVCSKRASIDCSFLISSLEDSKAVMITFAARYDIPAAPFSSWQYNPAPKFEEYTSAALAAIKYRHFVAKGEGNGVLISGGTGLASPWEGVSCSLAPISAPYIHYQTSIRHGHMNSSLQMLTKFGIGSRIRCCLIS